MQLFTPKRIVSNLLYSVSQCRVECLDLAMGRGLFGVIAVRPIDGLLEIGLLQ